jgi:D-alanyl-D-alanine carboxypeptidase (penicillin-binding protein 5/6)
MNGEARSMGLEKTRFVEPSGISEYNFTTAREFALFCREYIRVHPETLVEFHSAPEFAYPKAENVAERYRANPGTIVQQNHNRLLDNGPPGRKNTNAVEGVDGLKTGYIDEAGYNIALTAARRGTRLIAVILGAPANRRTGERIRDEDGRNLLNWGFDNFKTLRPVLPELEALRVWKGKTNYVNCVPGETLNFTAAADRGAELRWTGEYAEPLTAPLPPGSRVGTLVLSDSLGELRRVPLVTTENVEQGGFFKRFFDSARLFFRAVFR